MSTRQMNHDPPEMNYDPDAMRAAQVVAPEDIQRDDYVAVLDFVGEYLTCGLLEDTLRAPQPVRVQMMMPWQDVYQVLDVCLPLVQVKDSDGDFAILDIRRFRLARLHSRFGRKYLKRKRRKAKADASPTSTSTP